jgi:hypothetical protein
MDAYTARTRAVSERERGETNQGVAAPPKPPSSQGRNRTVRASNDAASARTPIRQLGKPETGSKGYAEARQEQTRKLAKKSRKNRRKSRRRLRGHSGRRGSPALLGIQRAKNTAQLLDPGDCARRETGVYRRGARAERPHGAVEDGMDVDHRRDPGTLNASKQH